MLGPRFRKALRPTTGGTHDDNPLTSLDAECTLDISRQPLTAVLAE